MEDILPSTPYQAVIEYSNLIGWLVVFPQIVRGWKRRGYPSQTGLIFLSSTTMFWEEFYADWGAYLLWNTEFAMMPWGRIPYTTPSKPWYVLPCYGRFYTVILPGSMKIFKSLRKNEPEWRYWPAMFFVVMFPFYMWNFTSADTAAFYTYYFHYLYVIALDWTLHEALGRLYTQPSPSAALGHLPPEA